MNFQESKDRKKKRQKDLESTIVKSPFKRQSLGINYFLNQIKYQEEVLKNEDALLEDEHQQMTVEKLRNKYDFEPIEYVQKEVDKEILRKQSIRKYKKMSSKKKTNQNNSIFASRQGTILSLKNKKSGEFSLNPIIIEEMDEAPTPMNR